MTDRIECLRRKERYANVISDAGVVMIWVGLFGLMAAAFVYPNLPAVGYVSGAGAVLGMLIELIAGHFAINYRLEREDMRCTECGGTGYSGDSAVPNGGCWDCRGTGLINGGEQ